MRIVQIGSRQYTQVICYDDPGAGGACHKYQVEPVMPLNGSDDFTPFAKVNFQNGPIKENGVNGCHQEDLIAIVIDRLQCFQKGEYACRENAVALTKLEEALMWLRKRTQDRVDRGVEGTSAK
jgi:hypothetical protein